MVSLCQNRALQFQYPLIGKMFVEMQKQTCLCSCNMDSKSIRLEDDVIKSLRAIDMNFFCDNRAS